MAKTGRPPKYATAEQMQAAIDRYFEDCKGEPIIGDDGFPICDKWGKPFIIHQRPPTVTGLALALGFTSRQALLDYCQQMNILCIDALRWRDSSAEDIGRVQAHLICLSFCAV